MSANSSRERSSLHARDTCLSQRHYRHISSHASPCRTVCHAAGKQSTLAVEACKLRCTHVGLVCLLLVHASGVLLLVSSNITTVYTQHAEVPFLPCRTVLLTCCVSAQVLVIVAASHLDAVTFQICSQSFKIMPTALFAVWLLGQYLTPMQWASLPVLAVGVVLVTMNGSSGNIHTTCGLTSFILCCSVCLHTTKNCPCSILHTPSLQLLLKSASFAV